MEGRLKRGEIWTIAGGKDYAGKPRPAVILQGDNFSLTESITVCGLTTDESESSLMRLMIVPTTQNGLRLVCRLMIDKVTTIPKTKLGKRIGKLGDEDISRVNRALTVFLGIASRPLKRYIETV